MFRLINNLKNKKGFTLIELIVVLAVLAIIMAIAVPRFMGIQDESRINADAAAAGQIIKAARLQEAARNDGVKTIQTLKSSTVTNGWDSNVMDYPKPQSGTTFTLSGGADEDYEVEWEVNKGSFLKNETLNVTEGFESYTVNP